MVDELPAPELGAGQVRVRVARRGGELPRRPDRRRRVPDQRAAAVRPRQRVRRRGRRGGRRRRHGCAVGDRVFGTVMVGAFAEEVVVGGGRRSRRSRRRRRRAPPRRSVSPTARRTTSLRSVARRAAGRGAGRARRRRRRRAWPRCSSASRWAPTVTAVASSAEKLDAAAAHGRDRPDRPPGRRPAPALRERPARRRRRRHRPGRRRPGRARAAVAALRRPVRDRGLRLGDDPPHPAQPGAAQGHPGPGVPVPGRSTHDAPRSGPQRGRAARTCSRRAGPRPTSAPRSPSTRSPPRCGHVADGKAIGKVVLTVG